MKTNYKYKIKFKYRYGEDYVFCNDFKCDNYVLQPLDDNGSIMCTISRTNIIEVEELKKD